MIGDRAKPDASGTMGLKKYLLAGLVCCGKCVAKMHGNAWVYKYKGVVRENTYASYVCPTPRQGGCGGNSRNTAKVDDAITKLVDRVHDSGANRAGSEVEPEAAPELARVGEIDESLAEAYAAWKARQLPAGEYFQIRADLEGERKELLKAKAGREATVVGGGAAADVRARWATATMDEKRAFLGRYLTHVLILPIEDIYDPKKKRMVHPTRFNPDLIDLGWK